MTDFDLTKPQLKPESQADRELARLLREVDRTRAEYQDAHGEERDQCWRLYQRAMINYNAALARITGSASNRMEAGMDNRQTQGGMGSSTTGQEGYADPNATKTGGFGNQQETPEKIVERFKIPVKGDPTGNLNQLSTATADFARRILDLVPPGRERATAFTNLEQCYFWLNASVTRGTGVIPSSTR